MWNTPDEAREQILWGLSQADVVKISDEEAEFLWGITDEEKAAEKLQKEFGVKLSMVTMGPRGAYLSNEKAAARAACPRVMPVDTTGAGDIFGGSAVAWLLKSGKAPEELDEKELAAMGASIHRPACPQKCLEDPQYPIGGGGPKNSGDQAV
ncbi:MAG: carbohydrate kinase family protein [Enterocloster sp.]